MVAQPSPVRRQRAARTSPSDLPWAAASTRHVVRREAALASLNARPRHGCVTVEAAAGSGKTALLHQWRRDLLEEGIDVAWLKATPADDRPSRFLASLHAGLSMLGAGPGGPGPLSVPVSVPVPASVSTSAPVADADGSDAIERSIIDLAARLACWPRPLVWIVDDLHLFEDRRILSAVRLWLDYAPRQVCICLSSRSPIPVSLKSCSARPHLSLGPDDLRFSVSETEAYLRLRKPTSSPRELHHLHRQTDGWITGLEHLAATRAPCTLGRHTAAVAPDVDFIANYFRREVLTPLGAEDREMLLHCALPNSFCADLCAVLLDQARSPGLIATRLAALERHHRFVHRIDMPGKVQWYRLHPLLRDVLLADLQASRGVRVPQLHRAAWQWLESRGCIDEAIPHAVQAGEAEAAADMLEALSGRMITRGALRHLGSLLTLLPEPVMRSRVPLRLLVVQLRLYGRQLTTVGDDIGDLEQVCTAFTDVQRYALALLKAGLALQRDDMPAVAAMSEVLERPPAGADPLMHVRRANILAWLHMHQGRHDQARHLLDDAGQWENTPDRRLVADSLRGMSLLLEGRVSEADGVLRQVIDEADADVEIDEAIRCVAEGLLCDCRFEANDLEGVGALLDGRLDVLERASLPEAVLRALVAKACACRAAGSPAGAQVLIERLEGYAVTHGLARLSMLASAVRTRWSLADGTIDRSVALLADMSRMVDRLAAAGNDDGAEARLVLTMSQALANLHWHDFTAASSRLAAAESIARSLARWRDLAVIHAMQAWANVSRGQSRQAREHLVSALTWGHRLGLNRSLLDVSDAVVDLLTQLRDAGELDDILSFYAMRLLGSHAGPVGISAVSADPHPEATALGSFSTREREVLDLIAKSMPNKRIALILGITTHTVKFHLGRIYAKLGVNERQQALQRLRSLTDSAAADRACTASPSAAWASSR